MVRCAGARARPPPSPRRMRGRPTTPHDRRAACPLARGLRARMDRLSDRPPALHRRRQVLDLVLARPQPSLPPLRANGSLTPSRRSAPPDSSLASTQVGPTTAVTAGPVQVDIATRSIGVNFAYTQTLRRAGKRREADAVISTARDLYLSLGAHRYVSGASANSRPARRHAVRSASSSMMSTRKLSG